MQAAVVDASILIELSGERGTGMRSFLGRARLHAPQLVLLETTNALRRSVRSERRDPASTGDWLVSLARFPRLALHPHGALLTRVWSLRGHCTAYDASYVALAERLRVPLLTLDRPLARAASRFVEVVVPD